MFDSETTVGTHTIDTHLKKTNKGKKKKAAQEEKVVSVVIELESKREYLRDHIKQDPEAGVRDIVQLRSPFLFLYLESFQRAP